MKAISQKLTVVCLLFLALSIAIVVLYETDTLASGLLADDKQSEFIPGASSVQVRVSP